VHAELSKRRIAPVQYREEIPQDALYYIACSFLFKNRSRCESEQLYFPSVVTELGGAAAMDAERLLIERAKRRITIKQLAAKSGVNEHTISAIERGKSKPHAITLVKLADALGVELEKLLGKALAR